MDDLDKILGAVQQAAKISWLQKSELEVYGRGLLLSDGPWTISSIAARCLPDDASGRSALQKRLERFLADRRWLDNEARWAVARWVVEQLREPPPREWVIAKIEIPRRGRGAGGAASRRRAQTLSPERRPRKSFRRDELYKPGKPAGPVVNCEVAVGLCAVVRGGAVPVDVRLVRADDSAEDLALDMLHQWAHFPKTIYESNGPANGLVVSGAGFGEHFRHEISKAGLYYAAEKVGADTAVPLQTALAVATALPPKAWRAGVDGVRYARAQVTDAGPGCSSYLIAGRPRASAEPSEFFLTTDADLGAEGLLGMRDRATTALEDLRARLADYRGHDVIGWQHHATIALCCGAFTIAKRARETHRRVIPR